MKEQLKGINILNYKNEIIDFINENNLNDVFIYKNTFFDLYRYNLYIYIRVSTEKQEFGRQILEFYYWAKKNNITIFIDHIYCDKYTGKKTNREQYQLIRSNLFNNDYLAISELNRLGRSWDNTKIEWQFLNDKNINVIVLDNEMLSAKLPNEQQKIITLEYKFIRDIVFNAINYVASKKCEEVSRSTKDGLAKAKLKGKHLGKERSKWSSKENFINTLKYMIDNNVGQKRASLVCRYPINTFKCDLKKYYEKYNTKDYKLILKELEKEITN